MKLISMTDLVLQGYKINQINNYAKFLKQSLKLEMFVPCDDDGNGLEEPLFDEKDLPYGIKYQKAKEKVLFEGLSEKDARFCLYANETIEDIVEFDLTLTESAINLLGL